MRYLGSKAKLLSTIEDIIEKHNIEGETFGDLFAGTNCVGDYFKGRYKIQANDFLYFSYVISKAKLNNSKILSFPNFTKKFKCNIFDWFNSLEFTPDSNYFVYNNYTPIGERMFFTENNGKKIDGIRIKIEDLYRDEIISENEYFFLLASLIQSTTKFSNTSGTYEAFFKFWDPRATKDFRLEPLEINEEELFDVNDIYNENTNSLVRRIEGDIAYIDPPYTVTQYVSAYHMLDTIAKYDSPEIKGVGGKRGRGKKNSLYAQKTKALQAFEDLFRQINYNHILVSYSNQGIVSLEELVDLAKLFAKNGKVHIETTEYREYQNHRSSNKRNGKSLHEVIIYFQKERSLNKSPLNYSGSKDTLLPAIMKELPPSVNTFVDVMGGAFNVGANIVATECVIYNELNPYVFGVIEWLLEIDKIGIVEAVEDGISKYMLEKGKKEPFNNLRKVYNEVDKSPLNLYLLHMYSFQNMIRFNGKHKFNTPIGVAGYSEDIKQRILNFKIKSKTLKITNDDYTSINWDGFPTGTLFYFDPPYFITSAAYNDGKRGMKGWSADEEVELLNILCYIDSLGHKFMLSNVMHHKDRTNHLLQKWAEEHKYSIIEIGTSGWRYSKNEILIVNY